MTLHETQEYFVSLSAEFQNIALRNLLIIKYYIL